MVNDLSEDNTFKKIIIALFQNICRLDPRAVTEEVGYTPLEIAAINENTEGFDLLAPHYEDDAKKKIAQLVIWGLKDSVPSAAFKLLFESVPLTEVGIEIIQGDF